MAPEQRHYLTERAPREADDTHLMRGLADWRFNHYLTTQLLPVFYLLLVFGSVVLVGGIVGICFWLTIPWLASSPRPPRPWCCWS